MANITESIENLTASLQELTAQACDHIHASALVTSGPIAVHELEVAKEIELFVENISSYAGKTRNVSVGTY